MAHFITALLAVLLSAQCARADTGTINKYDVTLTFTDAEPKNIAGSVTVYFKGIDGATQIDLGLYWGSTIQGSGYQPSINDFNGLYEVNANGNVGMLAIKQTRDINELMIITANLTSGTGTFSSNAIYYFKITFTKFLTKDWWGMFYHQFTNNDQTISYLIATNLQPNYAHEVFPCNENAVAAVNLTLIKSSNTFTTASLPVISLTNTLDVYDSGTELVNLNFAGFALGTNMISWSSNLSANSLNLTFYSRKDVVANYQKNIDFLANLYVQAESLLGIGLSMKKLSIVLVPDLPTPFATSGIIYIRDDMYYGDYSTPQSEGRFRSLVVPVLHQYFLQFTKFSTLSLYDFRDDWLAQAMATFLKYTLLNNYDLPFDFKTDMDVVYRQLALAMDTVNSSALYSPVSPDKRSTIQALLMDPLKEFKGAFILTMADLSFPAGSVLTTIKNLLIANQKTSITTNSFFEKLTETLNVLSGDAKNALDSFSTWAKSEISYPLLFLSNFQSTSVDVILTETINCYVPVTVASKTDPLYSYLRQDIWMKGPATRTIPLNITVASDWVIANQRSNGYYRTGYAGLYGWTNITSAVASGNSGLLGYTHIIDDAFALAGDYTNSLLDYIIPLTMSVGLMRNQEKLFRNWFPVFNGLTRISNILRDQNENTYFKDFMTPFLQNLNSLLENGNLDQFEKARISSLFYDQFCTFNVGNYRSVASNSMANILSGNDTMLSSSYDSLVCCAAQNSNSLSAGKLWNATLDIKSSHYIRHYNSIALGCLSNYTDIISVFPSVMLAVDFLNPYILTSLWYLAEKQPERLLNSFVSVDATYHQPIAWYLQSKLGAPAVAALITRMAPKLSNASNFMELKDNTLLDTLVTTAAGKGAEIVNNRDNWLTKHKLNLTTALSATKMTATSGGTTSTLSVLLFLPLYALILSTLS